MLQSYSVIVSQCLVVDSKVIKLERLNESQIRAQAVMVFEKNEVT